MNSTTSSTAPCESCKGLNPLHNTTSGYHSWDFGTSVGQARKAADNGSGCLICGVLLVAACLSAEEDSFPWGEYCELDLTAPERPDQPLQLYCRDEVAVDFITTSALPEPFTQFKPTPLIAKHSRSPRCFTQIHSWMAECAASHEDCQPLASVELPTRVVDINPTPDGLRPILVTPKGAHGRYAALSYSWGDGLPLKLTRSSLALFMSGIPWTDIPKTLQDAMVITHEIGLRYIWIDSLTIVQDDEADWHAEATKMATVYGNAHVTIAATASSDCNAGIFASRESSATYYRVWPFPERVVPKPNPVEELLDGEIYIRNGRRAVLSSHPLQKRGWALQEHILSRRVLQYTSDQLIWHCRTARATEPEPTLRKYTFGRRGRMYLDPAILPPRCEIDAHTLDYLSRYWTFVITDYSARSLTRESDKLVALSGVAEALTMSGMGPYYAGVFESDTLFGLAWHSVRVIPDGPWAPTHTRPTQYRAPSWSWASLDGKVKWLYDDSGDNDYLRAPQARCTVVRISDTELVLRGKQIPGVMTRNSAYLPSKYERENTSSCEWQYSHLVISEGRIAYPETDIIDTTPMHPGVAPPVGLPKFPLDVICLQLGFTYQSGNFHSTVLVLARSPKDSGAYERIGIDYYFNGRFFDGVGETEITVI
ncbi:heterokaryon incompatibility protein-domain-containing protein [Podospora conica]|nr:heterokaryon incompatibility protein-domain-containing protein [Schizothecium conicum]